MHRVTLLDTGADGVHAFSGLADGVAHWTPDGERHSLDLDLPGQQRVAMKTSRGSQQRTPSVALAYAALRGQDPAAAGEAIKHVLPSTRGSGPLWDAAARVRAGD